MRASTSDSHREVVDQKNVARKNCFNGIMAPRRGWSGLLAAVVCAALLTGCARRKPVRAPAPGPGWMQTGIASWYGHPYHGRRAANGEVYDMQKLTAAHRTLPLGSWVEVRNLSNGREVQVRITDRGPFVEDRIIDLSKAAARAIAMIGPGTVMVRLTLVAPPEGETAEQWYTVQVGAFQDRAKAEQLRKRMRERFGEARLVLRDGEPRLWRVLIGRAPVPEEASALAEQLREELGAAFVVRLDEPVRDRL